MNTPIVLKAADVIAAARKAYEEKRLSAQGPTPKCSYRDRTGHPCAVGAALDEDAAQKCDNHDGDTSVPALVRAKLLRVDNLAPVRELQAAHDAWAQGRMWEEAPDVAARRENDFRALIGLDPLPVEG